MFNYIEKKFFVQVNLKKIELKKIIINYLLYCLYINLKNIWRDGRAV